MRAEECHLLLKGRTGLLEARWFKSPGFSLRSLASSIGFIAMKGALCGCSPSTLGTSSAGCSAVTRVDARSLPVASAALTQTSPFAALGVGAIWKDVKTK